jgi:transcriptional regulator with XRE-family HTH domain
MRHDTPSSGDLLRRWRHARRLSQLALASEAGISQRHLSFLESGRSRPSPGMVLRLGEILDVPLRERNAMLMAAGHAPHYPQHPIEAPELSAALSAIEQLLEAHLPHPALVVDRGWNLLRANRAVYALLDGVAPHLLEGRANVLRLSLHPEGLAPRILNLDEWRDHILRRLSREAAATADPAVAALRDELGALAPRQARAAPPAPAGNGTIAVPLRLRSPAGPLSFLSTTTVFGTAVEVSLSEVTIESFLPADAETAEIMGRLARETDAA